MCYYNIELEYIRLSQKFLSFYKEIIDAQHFLFYFMLFSYILLLQNKSYIIQ